MVRDVSSEEASSHDARAVFSDSVATENEPFLSETDLTATEPQRHEPTHRVHRLPSDEAMRTRLLQSLPPQFSQWLQAAGNEPRRTSATTTLRVPVTLRVLPGNTTRHAIAPRLSLAATDSLDEILIDDTNASPVTSPETIETTAPLPSSPTDSPRSTASSDDGSQHDDMSTLDEFQTLFRRCHHTLPFVALFLLYFVYQHVVGIAVFAIGSVAIGGLDQRLRAQIALKENAKRIYLIGIAIICLVDTIVISSFDGEPNPFEHLTYTLHSTDDDKSTRPHGALILDLLWIVLVNDFIVRFVSMAVKACVAVVGSTALSCTPQSTSSVRSPGSDQLNPEEEDTTPGRKLARSNVAFYRRKRKLYGIIELTSIFIRSLLAGLPWCSYYQLCGSKFMADVFTFFYVFGKSVILGSQGRQLLKLVRSFLTLGLEHASYVTREELTEAGCPDCSICYEVMQTPVKLTCSHMFCEECVMEWFDRERSCPLCRAAIVTSQADGELKPQFLDGSTSLFPQLF